MFTANSLCVLSFLVNERDGDAVAGSSTSPFSIPGTDWKSTSAQPSAAKAKSWCLALPDVERRGEKPTEPHGGGGQPQGTGLSKEAPFPVGSHAPSCPEASALGQWPLSSQLLSEMQRLWK